MNLQQISENLIFLIFSVLLSSLAMACLNQLKPKDPEASSRLEVNISGLDKSQICRSGNQKFHWNLFLSASSKSSFSVKYL